MPALIVLTVLAVASVLLAVGSERGLLRARNGSTPVVPFGRWSGVVAALIPAALALAVVLATDHEPLHGASATVAVMVAIVAAVAGGAPLSLAMLHLADPDPQASPPPGTAPGATPGAIAGPADPWLLRGGFWIGLLERAGVAFSILTGWPEGVGLVLVVKGFGRYPELRYPPAAERFIIGTLVSVLWAGACAWTALWLIT